MEQLNLDENLVHNATHLWRNVVTQAGANHELGTKIWVYKVNVNYGNKYLERGQIDRYEACKQRAAEVEKQLREDVYNIRAAMIPNGNNSAIIRPNAANVTER